MTKTLVLIRHGHRDTSRRELDNGLSGKGRSQAKALRSFFMDRFAGHDFGKGLWLVSSPKLRCQETLTPLAKAVDRSVDVHPDLDQQGSRESLSVFEGRVVSFLTEWKASAAPLTVLGSHGDWLPVAIKELLGLSLEFRKGSWTEIELRDNRPFLTWSLPTFKHFYKF
jgi:broad specificity phosphatase PhoE